MKYLCVLSTSPSFSLGQYRPIHLYPINRQQSPLISAESHLPSHAQVVIAGAGVVGNSVAYHLTENGWNDICILERNNIGTGSSSYGSGILGQFKPTATKHLIRSSIELYKQLEEKGFDIGFRSCGSLNLAQTIDRITSMKRRIAYNRPTGLYCEMVDPQVVKRMHPLINIEKILGAVWVPDDAVADPPAICAALATLAKHGGAKYVEHCRVEWVNSAEGRQKRNVTSVDTNLGRISCEYFVNCGGMWSRELGLQSEPPVCIPTYAADHFYATTKGLEIENGDMLPVVRDYDAHTYFRQLNDGELMVGWFEQLAKVSSAVVQMDGNETVVRDDDLKHCQPLWKKAIDRMPILGEIPSPTLRKIPNTFTPDGRWVLGEAAEIKNYFVAVGMNGNSLQGAGGIGKAVAEWLIGGSPTEEPQTFSVQRFLDLHNNRRYLEERTKEIVGRHYGILFPHQNEYKFARKLRCSPLYSVLQNRGAVFGTKMVYERALYFDLTYKLDNPIPTMPPGSFYKPKFIDFMHEEYNACREGVGIIDMSSFSKIEIKAAKNENAVVSYLQKMCSNDVNIPVGGIVHTGMQNKRGGYVNDCILVRQSNEKFFMVSPSNQQTRIFQWMFQHLPEDGSVCLNDLTSMYTVINVVGPKAVHLMSALSNSDINLPPYTYRRINVAYASDVMVMSYTDTGEQGYCLYIPSEYALHVYDRLMTIGRDFGARDVGTLTQRFMRIEKFIPLWAEEITSYVTPFETGYGSHVKFDKGDFIGKEALEEQSKNGVTKHLVMFHIHDIDPDKDIWPWGGEPIYRNGEYVGSITSAGFSFSMNKLICLGFVRKSSTDLSKTGPIVTNEYILDTTVQYEIDIAGHRFPLRIHLQSPNGGIASTDQLSSNGTGIGENTDSTMKQYKPTVVKVKKNLQKN